MFARLDIYIDKGRAAHIHAVDKHARAREHRALCQCVKRDNAG